MNLRETLNGKQLSMQGCEQSHQSYISPIFQLCFRRDAHPCIAHPKWYRREEKATAKVEAEDKVLTNHKCAHIDAQLNRKRERKGSWQTM